MRILCYILVVLFVTTTAVGQQINPVPDYIFRNSMSVGRNAPTDTSAYFSIGPRFGATRGFMPPMVVDTAAVTGTKRNGLLIYSIQRNSYLYWDSTGSRWSRIAANLDTLQLATRAWRQKGIDSLASVRIGGSGVTGYIPKFTAARTLDSSQIFQLGGNIGIGTATPSSLYKLDVTGAARFTNAVTNNNFLFHNNSSLTGGLNTSLILINGTTAEGANDRYYKLKNEIFSGNVGRFNINYWNGTTETTRMVIFENGRVGFNTSVDAGYGLDFVGGSSRFAGSVTNFNTQYHNTSSITSGLTNSIFLINGATAGGANDRFYNLKHEIVSGNVGNLDITYWNGTTETNRMRIFANGRIGVNTTTDAGYQFDVAGSMRNTTDAYFATSSGNVGIGTTTPGEKLDLNGNGVVRGSLIINNGSQNVTARVITPSGTTGRNVFFSSGGGSLAGTGNQASRNTSVGFLNLGAITTGSNNTAIGNETMNSLTTGGGNTSLGSFSMSNITTGSNNVGIGAGALNAITIANNNIAVGTDALGTMITGTQNTALGWSAGRYRLTSQSNSKSNNSVYIGYDTRSSADSADNEIVIGASVIGSGTNTVTIGNSSITQNYFTGEMLVGYTSDQGAFSLQANGNALINGNIRTAAPAGGTANDWRLGTVATVTPTSPNRTIEVSIGGTIYYIHAKTTND